MRCSDRLSSEGGFTLVELLIVIIILAVLASIAIPRFMNSGQRSKETSLKSDLRLLRDAVQSFDADCGAYPSGLAALTATSPPASGVDTIGAAKAISASDWHGPYLMDVPTDPVSGGAFKYSVAFPNTGGIASVAPGTDSDGIAFTSY